jgi:hypothetical protein
VGVYISLIAGMVIWIVGSALFSSTHANFDWFMPLPVIVLLAFAGRRARAWFQKAFRA